MASDIIRRFQSALPQVRGWIDQFVEAHANQVRSVASLGFDRLPRCYPQDLLERTKVISVASVAFPPVGQLGLPELAQVEALTFAGITFGDTVFVQETLLSESLCFHELVHVVQWATLGADDFLRAYGLGLLSFGYTSSPLEQMAYELQHGFDNGIFLSWVVPGIQERTTAIWEHIKPVFQV